MRFEFIGRNSKGQQIIYAIKAESLQKAAIICQETAKRNSWTFLNVDLLAQGIELPKDEYDE